MHTTSLWRNPDFARLWLAATVSQLGSAITGLALPLTAVVVLQATPAQMGLLGALGNLPVLVLGLFAGVLVDRVRRRPLLIGAEWGRAMLLALIPAFAALQLLRIELLYGVAVVSGVLALLFDIAHTSYLPVLLARDRLVEGNARLQTSSSIVSVAGPALAGGLIQLVTAPLAMLADALSFVCSALCLQTIRHVEAVPAQDPASPRSVKREIAEGIRVIWDEPILRATIGASAIGAFAVGVQQAVLFLFLSRELALSPAVIGVVFAAAGCASLLGAVLSGIAARRLGIGPAVIAGTALVALGHWCLPLAGGPWGLALPLLLVAQLLSGSGTPIYSVNQLSLRQGMTPNRLLGRVNAGRRVVVFGAMPFGALLGGVLGERIGLRATLVAGAVVMTLSLLYVWLSPVRTVREQPGITHNA